MIKSIRNIKSPVMELKVSKSESQNLALVRKSIVAKHSIKKGELFTTET